MQVKLRSICFNFIMDLIHGWLGKNRHSLPLQSAANRNCHRSPFLEATRVCGWDTTRRAARQRADVTPTPPAPRPAPELPQSCRGAPGGSGERQPEGRRRALAHSSPAIPADLKAVFQAIGPVWGREVPVLCLLALPGVTSNLSAGGSGLLAFWCFHGN